MLSIEASLQQRFPLNKPGYYITVFLLTVVYYTYAYLPVGSAKTNNPRTEWYAQHRKWIKYSQAIFIVTCLAAGIFFLIRNGNAIKQINAAELTLALIFPLLAFFYYGIDHNLVSGFNLRSIGWLKHFLIGFVWAGLVTVFPVWYYFITREQHYAFTIIGCLLFLKNFMFITVLGIMFDIKDYATDSNRRLKTFVVSTGLRKTIFYIIIPLSVLGLGTFLAFGLNNGFSAGKIMINCIPFILLITVAWSLYRRKSILFYLVIIDGLMLVKAICGIVAMIYF